MDTVDRYLIPIYAGAVVPTVNEYRWWIPLVMSTVRAYLWWLPLVVTTVGGEYRWWLQLVVATVACEYRWWLLVLAAIVGIYGSHAFSLPVLVRAARIGQAASTSV